MAPRSTGCANCRKRKIKCDETRPGCKKCQVHNTPCPGYRGMQPDGLEWRDETATIAQRVERARRSGSNSSGSSSGGEIVLSTGKTAVCSARPTAVAAAGARNYVLPTVIPQKIFSAASNRAQMFHVSMRLYRPDTLDDQPKRAHISDFSILQKTINSKSSPALLAAIDTLSLLQLGVSYQDESFFLHARKRYGQALSCLVVALGRPNVLADNDVLGAMKLLEFCELFHPVAQQGSWISHVNGVENFLQQRGPVPLKTELDNHLFFHARHSSILQGVLRRKALTFAEPKWMAVARNTTFTDSSPRLFDVLIHIPGLFERADRLIAGEDATYLNGVVVDLVTAIENLQAWEIDWSADMDKPPFTFVDVERFTKFCQLCKNRTFTKAVDFPIFLTAYVQSIYWLYVFAIERTLQDVLAKYPGTKCSLSQEYLNRQTLQNAIYMCQMMPYFCEPGSSSMGRFATFMPLIFAMKYFEGRGMKEELKWCTEVTEAVYRDGINPPWRLDLAKGLKPGEKKQ